MNRVVSPLALLFLFGFVFGGVSDLEVHAQTPTCPSFQCGENDLEEPCTCPAPDGGGPQTANPGEYCVSIMNDDEAVHAVFNEQEVCEDFVEDQTGQAFVGQRTIEDSPVDTVGGLLGIVETILNWIFTLFGIVAVIFVLYAAWKFVTGSGNPDTMNEARQMLIYAAIGVGVALLARGLEEMVRNLLGA